jgi:hypothetical protein
VSASLSRAAIARREFGEKGALRACGSRPAFVVHVACLGGRTWDAVTRRPRYASSCPPSRGALRTRSLGRTPRVAVGRPERRRGKSEDLRPRAVALFVAMRTHSAAVVETGLMRSLGAGVRRSVTGQCAFLEAISEG